MRKIKYLIAAVLLTVTAFAASAQTTSTNTPTIPSFFSSVYDYATTINTNYTFSNVKIDVETGYKQATGTGASSFTKLGYYITPAIELDGSIGYFGAGSTVNSFEAGVGYAVYQNYDLRITTSIYGGYDATQRAGEIEPAIELKKKLSINTYASIGISLPYFVGKSFNTSPTFTTGLGFTLPEGVIN